MCKYCKKLIDNKDNPDDYVSIDLSRRKIIKIGKLDLEIVLSMEYVVIKGKKERELALVGSLYSENSGELVIDSTFVKTPMKFCPYCGGKFDDKKS